MKLRVTNRLSIEIARWWQIGVLDILLIISLIAMGLAIEKRNSDSARLYFRVKNGRGIFYSPQSEGCSFSCVQIPISGRFGQYNTYRLDSNVDLNFLAVRTRNGQVNAIANVPLPVDTKLVSFKFADHLDSPNRELLQVSFDGKDLHTMVIESTGNAPIKLESLFECSSSISFEKLASKGSVTIFLCRRDSIHLIVGH